MSVNKKNYNIDHFHNSKFVTTGRTDKYPGDLQDERILHLDEVMKYVTLDGDIVEFGVHKAQSINQIADKFTNQTIHGFDSFKGLPEAWPTEKKHLKPNAPIKHKKGYFALDELPEVRNNVKLWEGWFTDTIPLYKEEHKKPFSFLHVDSDLYSSAKTIFDELNNYIVKDTIILFDEFYAWGRKKYELWEQGEYKACKEWIEKYNREFEVLTHNNHQQTSIRIIK